MLTNQPDAGADGATDSVELAPDRGLGFLIADISRMMRREFQRRIEGRGVTLAQARALVRIERSPGLRQVALADQLEIQPITLARILDQLQEQGLVERRADPDDRRAHRLYLTTRAAVALRAVHDAGDLVAGLALRGLSPQESAAVVESLRRIRVNLA